MSHYDYLNEHIPAFFEKVGANFSHNAGIVVAHGDKCYGARDIWEQAGLHFYHGAAIYLLTYVAPFSREVRETEAGWVAPLDWVLANKDRFLPFLPPVTDA